MAINIYEMMNSEILVKKIKGEGFAVIEEIFSDDEVKQLIALIENADATNTTFRKTQDLFAIRQFLKEIPKAAHVIFNQKLNDLNIKLFGNDYFITKSIYFDKTEQSNWFVAYHQDLTISVDQKKDIQGFGPWTVKQNQFAVQPPLHFLENNYTIRIHLDDTDEGNGALKVIPASHLKGIYRAETIDWTAEKEVFCNVKKGGVMIMKPLLLHASNRTTTNKKRRVIHIEFSNVILENQLNWAERQLIPSNI